MIKIFMFLLGIFHLEAQMTHCIGVLPEWKEESRLPFNELILSWNGERSQQGKYQFYVSILTDQWSPWMHYATWGSDGQSTPHNPVTESAACSYQDVVSLSEGKATGFKIKIELEGGAELKALSALHVYTNGQSSPAGEPKSLSRTISLQVPGLSQMALDHPRAKDLCSPTSTTAVVRALSKKSQLDPCLFAEKSWDGGFDIYGNWVFNVAQASTELGPTWHCWVERLCDFEAIYSRLEQGTPVIVSVRGPLPGSAAPYAKGHLMAVIGYDALHQKVLCLDPAFPTDPQTLTSYDLADFIEAWTRRGRLAYLFAKAPH